MTSFMESNKCQATNTSCSAVLEEDILKINEVNCSEQRQGCQRPRAQIELVCTWPA